MNKIKRNLESKHPKLFLLINLYAYKKSCKKRQEKKLSKVEIPENTNDDVLKKVIESQFKYSVIGYVIGVLIITLGIVLIFFGIFYPLNKISFKFLSFSISANNATLGIILFLIGLFVIVATRFSVKIKKN